MKKTYAMTQTKFNDDIVPQEFLFHYNGEKKLPKKKLKVILLN